MRLIMLTVMGLIAGLGLAAAIVSVPVMAEKGPLRATLVAHLGGGQEEDVQGGGDPDGQGRAVVKVFKEQLCVRVKTGAIETSPSKATIHLGMSGEKGPIVANLQEQAAGTPLAETTTPTTTTTGTTTPTTGTTTATTGATGTQTGTTTTTTTGDTTLAQATTTAQSTTVEQTSHSQSTASPTASASATASDTASAASASASASAASTSRATIHEHTSGCVAVPRALSLELLEHPRRFYVNVTTEQSAEGAIRDQLHRSGGDGEHRSGEGDHRSGNDDD